MPAPSNPTELLIFKFEILMLSQSKYIFDPND